MQESWIDDESITWLGYNRRVGISSKTHTTATPVGCNEKDDDEPDAAKSQVSISMGYIDSA